jgi:hypothetical protein
MSSDFDAVPPGSAAASDAAARDFPILGDWPYDEDMVGMGFFPEEVALRPAHPRSKRSS